PGKITLQTTIVIQKEDLKSVKTDTWNQSSDNQDDHIQQPWCGPTVLPESGYVILPETVHDVIDGFRGGRPDKWDIGKIRYTNPSVCYWVTTIQKWGPGAVSGQVWFHFEYTMRRYIPDPNNHEQQLALTWGQSRALDVPTGASDKWKIIYESFDGTVKKEFVT